MAGSCELSSGPAGGYPGKREGTSSVLGAPRASTSTLGLDCGPEHGGGAGKVDRTYMLQCRKALISTRWTFLDVNKNLWRL